MMKWLMWAAVAAILLFGACQLLPERYAVNAPVAHMLFGTGAETPEADQVADRMRAAAGFSVGIWAEGIPNARFLRFTESGDLLVSQPRSGQVTLLWRDQDGDGRSDGSSVLADQLNRPHGLELRDSWLYIGEGDGVVRMPFDAASRSVGAERQAVVSGLPEGGNHWSRTVRFGPDGRLYVSVGSSCNVCIEEDERRAAILRFAADGSEAEVFASGLRNSVGFDWQPGTNHLYATDNGRDLLGDAFPPCELNRVERGAFYGWPFANGDRVADPDFGEGREQEIRRSTPPAHPFGAHHAPLGIAFVRGDRAPDALRGAALVALHGSWNRTSMEGYKVVSLHWNDGRIEERDFLVGFELEDDVIGRPVDVAEGPDGAIYVSDDYAGVIWRVTEGSGAPASALPGSVRSAVDPLATLDADARARGIALGGALYEAHACASCHEAQSATSGVVARPLAKLASRYDIDGIAAFLATPTPPMPVFPLSAEEKRDLGVYLLDRYR